MSLGRWMMSWFLCGLKITWPLSMKLNKNAWSIKNMRKAYALKHLVLDAMILHPFALIPCYIDRFKDLIKDAKYPEVTIKRSSLEEFTDNEIR